ncbi:uncharacterized protein LOC135087736 isoform X2 [Ostrinia nubilalis]|uniref:uncharacterized protein LOC135071789 isoform X2 n=1 Tax=Ostrinia nubilalis TaxID=29057 RepID=UPI003082557F
MYFCSSPAAVANVGLCCGWYRRAGTVQRSENHSRWRAWRWILRRLRRRDNMTSAENQKDLQCPTEELQATADVAETEEWLEPSEFLAALQAWPGVPWRQRPPRRPRRRCPYCTWTYPRSRRLFNIYEDLEPY